MNQQPRDEPVGEPVARPVEPDLGLGGRLPCAVCGYDLQSISILGVCPECGTAVRATILAVVDPLAAELKPIRHAALTAAGLIVWSGAALAAALVAWRVAFEQIAPIWANASPAMAPAHGWVWAIIVLVAISGLGAAVFAWPQGLLGRAGEVWGLIGVGLYAVIGVLIWRLDVAASHAPLAGEAVSAFWMPRPDRTAWRIALGLAIIASLVCLRPTARALVSRSLVLRTGRVDRQTILAMIAAMGLLMVGDLAGLASERSALRNEVLSGGAIVLMLAGGLLFTLGLVGALVDCARIARALIAPSPGLSQVLHGKPERGGGSS